MAIIECVPNFSEGRNRHTLQAIVDAASNSGDIKVANYSMDTDHNRSVLTLIGEAEAVTTAALAASEQALKLIDMRKQEGIHPRIGAVDVVPFIPLKGAVMDDAVAAAHHFGREFARRTGVPVFFYGEAVRVPARRRLAEIRRGEYESLARRFDDPAWQPDEGPARFNPKAGATAVGARKPLVAFNVNLATDNLDTARRIARTIRQSSGGLAQVQAIGVTLKSRNIVQVSMNLTDCDTTPIIDAYEAIRKEAAAQGVDILESELIGLAPENALSETTAEHCRICNFSEECLIEYYL